LVKIRKDPNPRAKHENSSKRIKIEDLTVVHGVEEGKFAKKILQPPVI